MSIPFQPKRRPPFIDLNCQLLANLSRDGEILTDDEGNQWLIDLSGGAEVIEWHPYQRAMVSGHKVFLERGLDDYILRVWKRRHGPLFMDGGSGYDWTEPAFTDPWADWLDQHLDLSYLIAGVEFKIMSVEPYRNGVNYWMTGRRVATS